MTAMVAAVAAGVAAAAAAAIAPAASWQPLPELVAAATGAHTGAARGASLVADAEARAWGDPASGCFAVVDTVAVPGPIADPAAAIADAHAAFAAELSRRGARIGGARTDRNESTADIELGSLRGRVRVRAELAADGHLRVTAAACAFNPRDRARSAAQCEQFWSTF
ncbi:MAG: hypothetical protein D6689_03800 [Deltaproteobacteria bacterium]|nr:MAG: hypothetical protein D6689_03800 [Deltaproteobacteria bacterium]